MLFIKFWVKIFGFWDLILIMGKHDVAGIKWIKPRIELNAVQF